MSGRPVPTRRNIIRAATYAQVCCMQHTWAHARRDFVECEGAADTPWKRRWLERIAAIYRTHRRRQRHFRADRTRQVRAFRSAQRTLEAQVKALFADADAELAECPEEHPRAKPLRRLLKWRHGLERFVADPEVPIDNNASHADIRFMPTTRSNSLINHAIGQSLSA